MIPCTLYSADKYLAYVTLCSGLANQDSDKPARQNENGFIWDDVNPQPEGLSSDDKLQKESTSEVGIY